MNTKIADQNDITRLFGALSGHTLLQILQTGANIEQLEAVALWLAQEDDVLGEARVPLNGIRAEIASLLEQDAGFVEPDKEF